MLAGCMQRRSLPHNYSNNCLVSGNFFRRHSRQAFPQLQHVHAHYGCSCISSQAACTPQQHSLSCTNESPANAADKLSIADSLQQQQPHQQHHHQQQCGDAAAVTPKHSSSKYTSPSATPAKRPFSYPLFEQQLADLASWKATFGTCHVPRTASDAAGLSAWVSAVRKAGQKQQQQQGKQGALVLSELQRQQLGALGFVWKPDTVEAKWHANYHLLRCWLDSGSSTLQQLLLLQQQQQGGDASPPAASAASAAAEAAHNRNTSASQSDTEGYNSTAGSSVAAAMDSTWSTTMQQQQQLQPELHEAAAWLQRQVQLYGKLKLTPVKVTMLRRLGVKLQRKSGLTKPNMHPLLQGQDPATYKRRHIVVTPATKPGRQAVGRLLAQQQQQQQLARQQPAGAETGTDLTADPATNHDNDAIVSDMLHDSGYNSYSRSSSFMLMLAQLQRWKKRHGSCHVPAAVFDKPELAQWVIHLRQRRAAAAVASSGAAADAASEAAASIGSSSSGDSDGDSAVAAAEQTVQPDQQQQQQCQTRNRRHEPLHLQPWWLKQWHRQELDAVGFVWQPSQEVEAWHARYHQLRHFKQVHHHLKVPASPSTATAAAAAAAAGLGTATEDGSSSSSTHQWEGLADWLQQQQQLMAASDKLAVHLQRQQGDSADPATSTRLSSLQMRMLKALGV